MAVVGGAGVGVDSDGPTQSGDGKGDSAGDGGGEDGDDEENDKGENDGAGDGEEFDDVVWLLMDGAEGVGREVDPGEPGGGGDEADDGKDEEDAADAGFELGAAGGLIDDHGWRSPGELRVAVCVL